MSFIRLGFVGLICVLLAGCGVRMEIATPTIPTVTPRPYPDIDYSLGGVWRIQAQPHVSFFAPDWAAVEIFPQSQRPVHLIKDRVLLLAVDYDVTWYAALQSSVQMRMTVYTRSAPDAPWESYDSLEQNLVTLDVPHTTKETPSLTLYLEDVSAVDVRTEISLLGYLADGTTVTKVSSNTFSLVYLNDPGEVSTEIDSLTPRLGDLSADHLLLDWRGWLGGPCELQSVYPLDVLETACEAYEAGDWDSLTSSLTAALEVMPDDWWRAAVQAQRGLVFASLGDYEAAASTFAAAVEGFSTTDDALQRVVGLHNWMSVLIMLGRNEEAYQVLVDLQEMRGQFYDELGEKLTQANIGKQWDESWRIEEAHSYFEDRESPLAEITIQWLDD